MQNACIVFCIQLFCIRYFIKLRMNFVVLGFETPFTSNQL